MWPWRWEEGGVMPVSHCLCWCCHGNRKNVGQYPPTHFLADTESIKWGSRLSTYLILYHNVLMLKGLVVSKTFNFEVSIFCNLWWYTHSSGQSMAKVCALLSAFKFKLDISLVIIHSKFGKNLCRTFWVNLLINGWMNKGKNFIFHSLRQLTSTNSHLPFRLISLI